MRAVLFATSVLSIIALLAPPDAGAQDAVSWTVRNKLVGENGRKSKDVSGIACATATGYPRACLVIDDNAQAAQAVTLYADHLEAGAIVPLIEGDYDGKPLELDGEGVAFADGSFYVMGSHGVPRHEDGKAPDLIKARLAAASQIVRVPFEPNRTFGTPSSTSRLTTAIATQPALKAAMGPALADNGLTIEGIAVRGDRLFAGFRGPTLSGHAAILSVSVKGLFGQGALDPHLFKLPLGEGQGVRDIAIDKDRFLVLAGPMADGPGRYAIFDWDGATEAGVREVLDLDKGAGIGRERKAEALLVLDEDTRKTKILLMFDGEKEGAPLALTITRP